MSERWITIYVVLSFVVLGLGIVGAGAIAMPIMAVLAVAFLGYFFYAMVWKGGKQFSRVWWKRILAGIEFLLFLVFVVAMVNAITGVW